MSSNAVTGFGHAAHVAAGPREVRANASGGSGAAQVGTPQGTQVSLTPTVTDARHLGGGAAHSGGHGFQEEALSVLAYRQQVIASNIANADTPGYKAIDVDFREALSIATQARQQPATRSPPDKRHFPLITQPEAWLPTYYHVPSQAAVDGNSVELDVERAKFAENAIRYEFAIDRVRGDYMHMDEMFKNLK